jgi:HD-GYP domain-containing protein (c-di-GMP phosphodiesterase class II)
VFASLVEERPYKQSMETKQAMAIMKGLAGSKLDADAARILQQLVDEGETVL